MQDLRICFLTENYPPQRGGMAQSCDRIVEGLRKRGYFVDVWHFVNKSSSLKTTQQLQGTYTMLPYEESEAHTLNVTWNVLQHHACDLLICFGGYLPILAAPVFAQWLQKPLITLLRGNDFDASIFTPRKRDILKDALLASQHVCVVSSDKAWKVGKLFPQVPLTYIANGIDLTNWEPSASEQVHAKQWKEENVGDKICIGVFGQLKAKKGLGVLINAMMAMSVLSNFHLLLIGEMAEETKELMNKSGISYSYYSFMDRYELLRYYLACDVVAITSYYDGMPNVLLEAGALGLPVIASRVDGMKDVATGKASELLFVPGDEQGCRMVLTKFIEASKAQRTEWGSALQDIIHQNFTSQHEIHAYEKIIDQLLHNDGAAMRLQSGQ